jgi:hypothetical protein
MFGLFTRESMILLSGADSLAALVVKLKKMKGHLITFAYQRTNLKGEML